MNKYIFAFLLFCNSELLFAENKIHDGYYCGGSLSQNISIYAKSFNDTICLNYYEVNNNCRGAINCIVDTLYCTKDNIFSGKVFIVMHHNKRLVIKDKRNPKYQFEIEYFTKYNKYTQNIITNILFNDSCDFYAINKKWLNEFEQQSDMCFFIGCKNKFMVKNFVYAKQLTEKTIYAECYYKFYGQFYENGKDTLQIDAENKSYLGKYFEMKLRKRAYEFSMKVDVSNMATPSVKKIKMIIYSKDEKSWPKIINEERTRSSKECENEGVEKGTVKLFLEFSQQWLKEANEWSSRNSVCKK